MPNVGFPEMIGILILALIVFGPKKLPEIGKSLGKALGEFKKVSREFSSAVSLDDEAPRPTPSHHESNSNTEER